MIVIIAEKTTQANKIASALSLKKSNGIYKGVFEGKPAILWAASGHLVEMSPPEQEIQNFSWNDPLTHESIPRRVPYKICPDIKGTNGYPDRKPAERVSLLNDFVKQADLVIGATDPDREGEVIYRSILEYINYSGPLHRVWLSNGLSESAIIASFSERKEASCFEGEYFAGIGRRMGDYGSMVLTTTYTYYARKGMLGAYLGVGDKRESTCSVGRVQSTTLGFTYTRHMERRNFNTTVHFKVKPLFSLGSNGVVEGKYLPTISDSNIGTPIEGVYWKEKNLSSSISPDMSEEEIEKLSNANKPKALFTCRDSVEAFKERLLRAEVTDITVEQRLQNVAPPKPLSMTKLQSLLPNETAKDVLESAERLYLAGFINYPRSEESEFNDKDFNPLRLCSLCAELAKWEQFGQQALAVKSLQETAMASGNIFKPKSYTSTDKSHEALSPVLVPKPGSLTGLDLTIFEKITSTYLLAHLQPSQYECETATLHLATKGLFSEPVSKFELSFKRLLEAGWEFQSMTQTNDMSLASLSNEDLSVQEVNISEHKTSPPPLYNQASLLFAMFHAAKFEPDPVLRASLKHAKGIGTTATRPGQIETLLRRGTIAYTSSVGSKTLDITNKGIELYNALPDSFKSAGTTAKWEVDLNEIARLQGQEAESRMNEFIECQASNTERLIKYLNKQLLPKTPKEGVHPRLPLSQKTAQQLEKRCKGLGLPRPREVLNSEAKAREWLKNNPWVVTAAMKRKINQIQTLLSVKAPSNANTDFGTALEFINKYKERVPSTPALGSIQYAQKLSKSTGLQLPNSALSDAKILNEYINQAKQIKAIPSDMLKAISILAKKHRVKVSTAELKDLESAKKIYLRLSRLN